MASVKKGQMTPAPSAVAWWKHLRKWGKRAFWKRERRAERETFTNRKEDRHG